VLAFAAEHRIMIAAQPAALLEAGVAAVEARLRGLAGGGYLVRERRLEGAATPYRITRDGLRAVGSDLPAPRPANLNVHDHDLGLGWLMVAAERGRFGPLRAVVSERRIRSDDGRTAGDEPVVDGRRQRHGVRLGGPGPAGRDRLHYPDMVLVTAAGRRIAFELELSGKPRVRREGILAAYAADPRIDLVVYLVKDARVGGEIARSVARVGIPELVRVERIDVDRVDSGRTRARVAPGHAGRGAATTEAAR
jgi:hypothetical protein